MKILAIVGNPRLKGNTSYLVDRVFETAVKTHVNQTRLSITELEFSEEII